MSAVNDALVYGFTAREPLPPSLHPRGRRIVRLHIGESRRAGAFFAETERLRAMCGTAWSVRSFDLLNVMCTLRAADRYYRSEGLFENTREVRIAVTVADRRHWQRLEDLFRRTVFTLSNDRLRFEAVALTRRPPGSGPADVPSTEELRRTYRPDCVCLFSGGADSFAGAAHLLSIGRRPLLIAHAVGPISGRQRELFEALQQRFPVLHPQALIQTRSYPASPRRGEPRPNWMWRQRDDLQRLRSMYFLSLAALIATGHGLDELFLCENGLIGAAIVWAPNQDTPYTTRPAEPHYLRQMQSFLSTALDQSLRIRNPFQYLTKGEVLRGCAELGLTSALHRTVSCWRSGNRGIRNCGQCVPCMFRQLAFDEAGLSDPKAEAYAHPIPEKRWSRWVSPARHRLYALRDYSARVVERRGPTWLLAEEPAVTDAIDVTGGPADGVGVDLEAHEGLDDAAPEAMASTIERFARHIVTRLA
jgi:7-cyano-7-deazaguanine synthase in queuosine biosynthesis